MPRKIIGLLVLYSKREVINMILSVSRRTDIPAFYAQWFMNRIREGFVMVRNPMNYHQVSKISLDPKVVDCIVFWTKNAEPLLADIDEISKKYSFYFQYTLNAYDKDIEPVTCKLQDKIKVFRNLSNKIGKGKIIWRYDPILITDKYSLGWHIDQFKNIAEQLHAYTEQCVFSFIDLYDKTKENLRGIHIVTPTIQEMDLLAQNLAEIARDYNMEIKTCAETINLDKYGIKHGCCIDPQLISKTIKNPISAKKDKNQRDVCGCVESIDIGQYNTCRHGCKYCYANFNPKSVCTFSKQYDVNSPMLVGNIEETDKITERKVKSLKTMHNPSLFA